MWVLKGYCSQRKYFQNGSRQCNFPMRNHVGTVYMLLALEQKKMPHGIKPRPLAMSVGMLFLSRSPVPKPFHRPAGLRI